MAIPVTVLEMKQDALDRGLGVIRKNYEGSAKKGRLTPEEERDIVDHLQEAPEALSAALSHDEDIAAMAHLVAPWAAAPPAC